MKAIRESSS
jgi:hypothetical protein